MTRRYNGGVSPARPLGPLIALCLAACASGAHTMRPVATFEPTHEAPVCDGPPLEPELLSLACASGEEPWEERYQNGSFLRECRAPSGEAVARLAISLSTTGCLEALDRWRVADGTRVQDLVGSWARERAHVELRAPCEGSPRQCRRGRFALSVAGGSALEGAFDEAGRPHGPWTIDARARGGALQVIELEHGNARITGLLEIDQLDCREGLVHGELVASRDTLRRAVTYEDGLPHGAFRLARSTDAESALMAGRYERGAPRGAWTLPTRACARTEILGCLEECAAWTHGSITGACEPRCQATPEAPLPVDAAVSLEPAVHADALRCDDVIVAAAGLALRLAGAAWLAEVHDHDLSRDLGGAR